jgi:hypothetical protein
MIEKNYIWTMMKKWAYLVLLISFCCCASSALLACSDPEKAAEVERLAIRNEALRRTVDSLQDEVNILKAQSDSVKNELKSLDMHR